jgi:hypothetical protein
MQTSVGGISNMTCWWHDTDPHPWLIEGALLTFPTFPTCNITSERILNYQDYPPPCDLCDYTRETCQDNACVAVPTLSTTSVPTAGAVGGTDNKSSVGSMPLVVGVSVAAVQVLTIAVVVWVVVLRRRRRLEGQRSRTHEDPLTLYNHLYEASPTGPFTAFGEEPPYLVPRVLVHPPTSAQALITYEAPASTTDEQEALYDNTSEPGSIVYEAPASSTDEDGVLYDHASDTSPAAVYALPARAAHDYRTVTAPVSFPQDE